MFNFFHSSIFNSCPSCTPAATERIDDEVKTFNNFHIEKIDRQKKVSSSNYGYSDRLSSAGKNSNQYHKKEKNWSIFQQEYLQVAVLTNANLSSFVPQGLSKYGHLGDGLLDLILIESVTRKEFLRYVKRNGTSKDQVVRINNVKLVFYSYFYFSV